MTIRVMFSRENKIDRMPIEMVERKGIGHPDTLADLVAEVFSNNYSNYCLEKFGAILNHWADKVTLSGAESEIDFGRAEIVKPITAYLFGKITDAVGNKKIPVEELFRESVRKVFMQIFCEEILEYIDYVVDINTSVGADRPAEYYNPSNVKRLNKLLLKRTANDTVFCCGYSNYSKVELLAIGIENYINSAEFKQKFPETGSDVKVLIFREGTNIKAILCIPFIAKVTPTFEHYKKRLRRVKGDLLEKFKSAWRVGKIELFLNTKDKGRLAYLTVFGTSLDKGDYGVVGRGNRHNGVISSNRSISIEASSGKNPLHHVGKLYHFISNEIAKEINRKYKCEADVYIVARGGDPLNKPIFTVINMLRNSRRKVDEKEVVKTVEKCLSNTGGYTEFIVNLNPIETHKKGYLEITLN